MPPAAIRLLVLILIFAATLLAVEGAINWYRSTRKESRAINQRLKLIEKGIDRAEVLSRIRREVRPAGLCRTAKQGTGHALPIDE